MSPEPLLGRDPASLLSRVLKFLAILTSSCLPRFPDGFEKFSPPILQLDEVDFCYDPSHYIFRSLSVSADLESRICVVRGMAERQ